MAGRDQAGEGHQSRGCRVVPADFIDLTPGEALFHASDGVHGDELWITDGTATGTKLVRDINPA